LAIGAARCYSIWASRAATLVPYSDKHAASFPIFRKVAAIFNISLTFAKQSAYTKDEVAKSALISMYEAFFGLNERPFSISPDPRFFYLTSQHREALTNCQYMITNRIGPVYVHGDVGTGKTTIARRLYQQLIDDPKYIVAMIISPNLKSANALLRLIMQEFKVKTEKKYEDSLRNLGAFLQQAASEGQTPVLFIDEAQLLKADMLELIRFLLNYETNTQKLLQIVLFGQNELAYHLESKKELKSRMYRSALASLTRADMEKMIEFRYQIAGGGPLPFATTALDTLFRCSLGLPREVCKLCDMALLRAFARESKEVTEVIIRETAEQLAMHEIAPAPTPEATPAIV
jgi:general secretion pathway protein A